MTTLPKILFLLLAMTLGVSANERPVDCVDPLIDTHLSRWFYFNSASRPFGMVNLSPDTQTKGSWKSGYLYGDTHIRCFSHVHAWQLAGIPVMPITGEMTGHQGMDTYQSEYSHDDEVVKPGYHKVMLKDYGITAELTSTPRIGFHRYTFPDAEEAYVLFDVGALLAHGPMVDAQVRKVSDHEIEGMSMMKRTGRRRKETAIYFVASFSEPIQGFGGWNATEVEGEGKDPKISKTPVHGVTEIKGANSGAYAKVPAGKTLLMKVAISYVSTENARMNLAAELAHWDFDATVKESSNEWNQMLSRIEVQGGTDDQRRKFYTDLWRAMLGRRIVSDVDGSYMDMTGDDPVARKVAPGPDGKPAFNMHNFDAWWGSHWSLNVLWPLLCPEVYSDFCNTSLEMYENGGRIPRGPSGGNYTSVMIGDSSAPALTSAWQKGIRTFDGEKALEGLVKNTGPQGGRYIGGYAVESNPNAWKEYEEKGYISRANSLPGGHGKAVSSLTMYNAYHDWCIAEMAKSLGKDDVFDTFIMKVGNYKNVIWPEKKCAWVRMPDGAWKDGFKPVDSVFEQDGFCEASAAMTTFFVPHDPQGLAEVCGGTAALADLLDGYFKASEPKNFTIGSHGRFHAETFVDYTNQDSTGMAHVFNRIGYPWLTQKWVRKVQELNYAGCDPYHGYNGDEDQGQMGAVSALMALGLFQFDGGSGRNSSFDLTAPIFDKVTIRLSEKYYQGKTVSIVVKNNQPDNVYIQSAAWNGMPWNACLMPFDSFIQGGLLELELGPQPNKQWGVTSN
ncbi:Glycosyl hydrolase family 92 [Planctomycetes bacterium CA13]|uniref:Glycosyl hydrolase family 92 n=1 Tax=Novipirellula herctigrandis TaxID=2527986 RepID=A0A5C5YNK1_9BACT|nr:Glycosyl hydrolase family 92 [Planctomycetes bacterium CA13]